MEKNNPHKNHRARMRETYLKHGLDAFSDVEKLEFLLFFAIPRKDTNPIAHNLLDEFGSFDRVLEAPIEALAKVSGMGQHSAMMLSCIHEAFSIYGRDKNSLEISNTHAARTYAANLFKGKTVEEFYVVCLSQTNKVIATKLINSGSVKAVSVEIRKITKIAIDNNCERIILMHNHPQGINKASDEDVAFTSKILVSCIINDIEVIDHIIYAGNGTTFSFESSDILKILKEDAVEKIGRKVNTSRFSSTSSNYVVND